jgi:hypothetical protein
MRLADCSQGNVAVRRVWNADNADNLTVCGGGEMVLTWWGCAAFDGRVRITRCPAFYLDCWISATLRHGQSQNSRPASSRFTQTAQTVASLLYARGDCGKV